MNLLDQLRDLRRRVRRLLWLNGLSCAIAGFLCGALLIGVSDWLWHFDDRGLRGGLLVLLSVAVSWVTWRRLITPLRAPLSNVELSGHIEQCFPRLRGCLATAVEFLERDLCPMVGSPELQRRLIEQTTSDVRSLNFAEVLDQREARRSILTLAAVCGLVLVLAAANTAAAATAVNRLLLGDQRWPKSVELRLVHADFSPARSSEADPLRSLQGQPLDLFVINARGALPQPVLVEFRRRGHAPQTEPLRTATLRDASDVAREAAAIRLPIDDGLIEFRAVAGDDHEMPWHKLWITPPPKLESFRVQVIPPTYTGEASTTMPEGATQVRTLLGSRLKLTARATRPIHAANWDGGPVTVSASGRDLAFEVTVQHVGSTTQRLSLTDLNQFENSSAMRLEVIGLADPPPTVSLEAPATDQLVTANGTVRVHAAAKDDRKLREIGLEYLVARAPKPEQSPDVGVRTTDDEGGTNSEDWKVETLPLENSQREAAVRKEWSLSELHPVVGDRISLRIVASDHCDVGEPRVGRSAIRTLTVVTPEAKLFELAQRLDLLLRELESLAARQSQTKDQTDELRVQAEKTGDLRPQDRDSLKRVELDQRQIGSRLIGSGTVRRGDDVTAHARELLAQLESNQLNDSATRERLVRIATAIETLNRETLPSLESTLGKVVKDMQGEQRSQELPRTFAEIVVWQSQVLSMLTELIRDLTQWRDYRELAREVAELAEAQESLNRETNELAPQTLGKLVAQLPGQQQADISKLADRQSRQAERIEQLRQRVVGRNSNLPDQNDRTQEGSVDNLAHEEFIRELDRRGLIAKSREAAQEVAANNLGQAAHTQRQLAEELKSLASKLAQTPAANSGSEAHAMHEFSEQLEALTQRQRRLLDETKDAAAKAESLTPEQLTEHANDLRERQAETNKSAKDLASRLKESLPGESLEALHRASRHMQQAESQLGDKQLARGADEQQTALEDLEQAGRELTAARRAAQQKELAEKTHELAEEVRELIARQKTVIEATERLAEEQQKASKWTRPLSKAALSLGEEEAELAEVTRGLSELLRDIAAVRLTLDHATNDLALAASRLRDKQLDEETRRGETSALRLLESLSDALSPPKPELSSNNDQQQAEQQNQNDAQQEPVPPVAQLQLLRRLQADVGDRTRDAETRKPNDPGKEDELKQLETKVRQIAHDQQSLREATSELLENVPTDPNSTDNEDQPRQATLSTMQQSWEGLEARDTGKPTQMAQRSAVESLDTLLKLWKQRAAQQQSLARRGQKAPMSENKPDDNSSTTTDGSGGKPTGRDSVQARNSSDRERTGVDVEGELRRQRLLRESVWGHLPPALREKMLNLPHDKTLPKYSEHIRRYYEALAEQN
jgi:hypothetical protein